MKRSALVSAPQKSAAAIESEAREVVRNAILREPDAPAANLAAELIRDTEPELVEAVAGTLLTRYFIRLVRSERFRAGLKPRTNHPLFPDLDLLPDRVTLPDGRRRRTGKLNITQVRARIKLLRGKVEVLVSNLRVRKELEQWETLEVRMESRAAQSRGITAAEVAGLENS